MRSTEFLGKRRSSASIFLILTFTFYILDKSWSQVSSLLSPPGMIRAFRFIAQRFQDSLTARRVSSNFAAPSTIVEESLST